MGAKGLTPEGLRSLGCTQSQATSWLGGHRQPKVGDIVKIAQWLEVPEGYLLGSPSELDGLDFDQAAARASLAFFFLAEGSKLAPNTRQIFEQYAESQGAPKTVDQWRKLLRDFFLPIVRYADETK